MSIGMTSLVKDLAPRILQLLHRCHVPVVAVRASSIPNAGNGVYTTCAVSAGEALCLYPGIYSPGLPQWTMTRCSFDDSVTYLGSILTPSGVISERNGYIMNLQTPTGGYIDGMALFVDDVSCHSAKSSRLRRLDENPSCCAHLLNHSKARSNVDVVPFRWEDALNFDIDRTEDKYDLPNVLRRDGSPYYAINSDIMYFDNSSTTLLSPTTSEYVWGAVLCATKYIEPDSELFLDYKLHSPLPLWAEPWYDKHS